MQCTIVWQKNWDAIHALNPDGSRKYRYIINKGSSRSSKTISLIDCFDLYARSNANKRLTVWRDTKTDCKKTVLSDTIKRLRTTSRFKVNQDFNKTESIFSYPNDSTFEIHGTDDEETVHGLTQDAAWLNEPYKISRETFDQIDQRTSDFVFIDLNPKKGHWTDDLEKDPRTLVIHSTFKDNPFCPPEQRIKILSYQPVKRSEIVLNKLLTEREAFAYDLIKNPLKLTERQIKELSRCRENEDKNSANDFNWSVYGLGLKGERPNRIFKWSAISDEEYKALDCPVYIGCDWGTVDPWAIVEGKYKDGKLYLNELNYLSENQWREKLSVTELSQINAQDAGQTDKIGIVTWLFNKLGISLKNEVVVDTNRPLKGAILRRMGYNVSSAAKAAGSIIDGIDLLNNLQVFYTRSSVNIEYEQENYSREIDNYGVVLEEPEDRNNHTMDAARYIALHLQARGVIKLV